METLLEYIITDFHERKLPDLTRRETALPCITGKVDTVIGMRRAGKTYFLYQAMQDQLKLGLAKEKLLYINFDDERLLPLNTNQLHLITEVYYRMFPEFKNEKCYFFFDEIQNVPGWERFVRRLLDTENVHLSLTGSSAKLLSKEIATTLRGRAITTEIFPFSFREALRYENPDLKLSSKLGEKARSLMANRMRRFLMRGGFPEVQSLQEQYRPRILQEYVDVVILRDIIERYHVTNTQALRAMVRHLLAAPATLFSVNKFYNDLKSQGMSCTKDTLHDYLDYLHDAYLVYPITIFTRSERVRRTNPRKVYIIDTGLINAFLHQPQSDWGHLLENFVYLELRRLGLKIEYYRTKENIEVDFITTTLQGEKALYQVALNLNDAATREREIRALELAMKECRIEIAKIITLDHRETLKLKIGIIEILPVWYWAGMLILRP